MMALEKMTPLPTGESQFGDMSETVATGGLTTRSVGWSAAGQSVGRSTTRLAIIRTGAAGRLVGTSYSVLVTQEKSSLAGQPRVQTAGASHVAPLCTTHTQQSSGKASNAKMGAAATRAVVPSHSCGFGIWGTARLPDRSVQVLTAKQRGAAVEETVPYFLPLQCQTGGTKDSEEEVEDVTLVNPITTHPTKQEQELDCFKTWTSKAYTPTLTLKSSKTARVGNYITPKSIYYVGPVLRRNQDFPKTAKEGNKKNLVAWWTTSTNLDRLILI
ncbi:hypothetical protein THAOC_21681 [Thalassiosira oceanica]|uniref:Uncharacterized protein n=1 Tax=Thalassiosira oceanica TaxID=159749 RepID=K0S0N0_THAOC|nr:hypothetical protein THAOC_21681 [Thalassiosira oceanica]|eukprot:EJK58214.1 hypothetical protein THAOC_21681 [Thalassiosira oceanica]